jgi:uncharacterized membrane protein
MQSLISPENSWALWSILIGIAALSIWLEQTYQWAAKVTGAIIGLVIAMVLANLRIIPTDAPTYDVVWGYVVPLAIPLLLFQANIRKIWRESGRIMAMFLLSSVGTVVGVFISFFALRNAIPELYKMAGMMTGSYTGGGVNFAAMASVFGAGESWISALTVADNLLMALYFFVLLAIPSLNWFRRKFTHPHIDEVEARSDDESETLAAQYWARKDISLKDIAFAVATAFIIVWVSTILADFFASVIPTGNFFLNLANGMLGNMYLMITTITMLLATFVPKFIDNINGAQEIGTFLNLYFPGCYRCAGFDSGDSDPGAALVGLHRHYRVDQYADHFGFRQTFQIRSGGSLALLQCQYRRSHNGSGHGHCQRLDQVGGSHYAGRGIRLYYRKLSGYLHGQFAHDHVRFVHAYF